MNDPAAPSDPASETSPSLARTIAENPGAAVAVAFAIGALCTTRPARCALRGAVHAALRLAKPALLVGGLLKLSELGSAPSSDSSNHPTPPTP